MSEDPVGYGLAPADQMVQFKIGSFDNVRYYLEKNGDKYSDVKGMIFCMIGMDDLAVDAPTGPLAPVAEGYFHPLGPRQFPAEGGAEEAASAYENLVKTALALFPRTTIFSSNPAPRRSGLGFAVLRASRLTKALRRQGERHHHFSVLRKFHGKRKKPALDVDGGRLPIYEWFFMPDGVGLTKAALSGVVVRARLFVETVLRVGGNSLSDPRTIVDLKMLF